jgi:hypothetical protein
MGNIHEVLSGFDSQKGGENREKFRLHALKSSVPGEFVMAYTELVKKLPKNLEGKPLIQSQEKELELHTELLPFLKKKPLDIVSVIVNYALAVSHIKIEIELKKQALSKLESQDISDVEQIERNLRLSENSSNNSLTAFFTKLDSVPKRNILTGNFSKKYMNITSGISEVEEYFSNNANRIKILQLAREFKKGFSPEKS